MKREYIPELDGFRVLMVYLVSWFHFWQQSWLTPYLGPISLDFMVRAGYMLVDGTILLSAFLLTLPYTGEGERVPKAQAFYRKRVMRIVPSFYAVTLLMLLFVVLPYHLYSSAYQLGYDLFMHALMIFNWDKTTYLGSQLGGSSWTIALEMQFYLLFPLLMRCLRKKPLATLLGMACISAYFRGWCFFAMDEFSMVVNQLLSFLDVYALGMGMALVYHPLKAWMNGKKRQWLPYAATACLILSFYLLILMLKRQAGSQGYPAIQSGQMLRRPILAMILGLMMLSLPCCVRPIRLLFANPITHFLSVISLNYYLVHQNVAVYLRRLGIPYSMYEYPNQAGDRHWQYCYSFLALGCSLALAVLLTYLVEKPCARFLSWLFVKCDRKKENLRRERAGRKSKNANQKLDQKTAESMERNDAREG